MTETGHKVAAKVRNFTVPQIYSPGAVYEIIVTLYLCINYIRMYMYLQRKWAVLSLGQQVNVRRHAFDPKQDCLGAMVVEVDFLTKKKSVITMWSNSLPYLFLLSPCQFIAHDTFVRTNRRAIAKMFVCLSGTGMHCDHTLHFNVNLSLWLDSPMFWAPGHQSMSIYS